VDDRQEKQACAVAIPMEATLRSVRPTIRGLSPAVIRPENSGFSAEALSIRAGTDRNVASIESQRAQACFLPSSTQSARSARPAAEYLQIHEESSAARDVQRLLGPSPIIGGWFT